MENYWKKNREKFFCWIDDFSLPQDQHKDESTRDLDWGTWFWFHPSAFALLYPAPGILGFFTFGIGGILLAIWKHYITAALLLVLAIMNGKAAIKSLKQVRKFKVMKITFYDFFIRDYKVGGIAYERIKKESDAHH